MTNKLSSQQTSQTPISSSSRPVYHHRPPLIPYTANRRFKPLRHTPFETKRKNQNRIIAVGTLNQIKTFLRVNHEALTKIEGFVDLSSPVVDPIYLISAQLRPTNHDSIKRSFHTSVEINQDIQQYHHNTLA